MEVQMLVDLTEGRYVATGQSSSTHGYVSGGFSPSTNRVNTIDKFLFSVDSNSTDIGDLTEVRSNGAGLRQQHMDILLVVLSQILHC
jgi:hypothetical protein